MKVLKRLNKLHDKILKKMARGLPVDHKLVMDVMARTAPYVVDSDPEMIFYMTEPSKEVQLKSLRSDGKLLLRKSDWTIDTEAVFPGSTAFTEYVQPRMELCKVDNENLPFCRDMFKNRKPSKADCMWDPIRQLSMLPAADITDTDRAILRGLPYPEAVLHIQYLLDKHASPQREFGPVVTPELQTSFNHCLAMDSNIECANDNVMVIKA